MKNLEKNHSLPEEITWKVNTLSEKQNFIDKIFRISICICI